MTFAQARTIVVEEMRDRGYNMPPENIDKNARELASGTYTLERMRGFWARDYGPRRTAPPVYALATTIPGSLSPLTVSMGAMNPLLLFGVGAALFFFLRKR